MISRLCYSKRMLFLDLKQVSVGFGGPLLLERIDFQIKRGERVCLLGRNGAGKTTFLKLLAGQVEPDQGTVFRRKGLRTAYLSQTVPDELTGSVRDIIKAGGNKDWRSDFQIDRITTIFQLDPDIQFKALSAGLKRRVLLARELNQDPDVLLLDEPTNHLDIATISGLEDYLIRSSLTLLLVTHDRALLQKIAGRIIELDRGVLWDWNCGYTDFLKRKEELLKDEAEAWKNFAKKLSREELWIRQGIKARRTRNEGRVKKLRKMREELRRRRKRIGKVRLQDRTLARSSKLVIQAEDISFNYADKLIFRNFSTTIEQGDRVGIIGANGSGKTTLLKVLLGELTSGSGRINHGPGLQVAYLDQLREQLHPDKNVLENVGEGRSVIDFGGRATHIYSYLQDFLFTPEDARTPVKVLSGGEKSRLLLARLFSRPFNVLVLDEPTNDLDIETLEMLEDMLLRYKGTLLLVSHDRSFLNNVVTGILAMEGGGKVGEYVGGYDDWLRQQKKTGIEKKNTAKVAKSAKPRRVIRKRTYKENKELEALPAQIEALEKEQAVLFQVMSEADFYKRASSEIAGAQARIKELDIELQQAYKRWEELEALPD